MAIAPKGRERCNYAGAAQFVNRPLLAGQGRRRSAFPFLGYLAGPKANKMNFRKIFQRASKAAQDERGKAPNSAQDERTDLAPAPATVGGHLASYGQRLAALADEMERFGLNHGLGTLGHAARDCRSWAKRLENLAQARQRRPL